MCEERDLTTAGGGSQRSRPLGPFCWWYSHSGFLELAVGEAGNHSAPQRIMMLRRLCHDLLFETLHSNLRADNMVRTGGISGRPNLPNSKTLSPSSVEIVSTLLEKRGCGQGRGMGTCGPGSTKPVPSVSLQMSGTAFRRKRSPSG